MPVLTDVPYKELMGSLIFCMVCTRPDIAFAVSCLTSYFSAPRQLHWDAAIRCLGYSMATKHHGIMLGEVGSGDLVAYSDSDWASDPVTRRSVGGHVIFFGKSILSWSSKTQKGILALSTTEAEFIQMAVSIRHILFLQPIFRELGVHNIGGLSVVLGDNKPAISSVGNESVKSRTKHLDVHLKFCGEVVKEGLVKIKYVSTVNNIADIFTKPLPSPRFRLLRDALVSDIQRVLNNK